MKLSTRNDQLIFQDLGMNEETFVQIEIRSNQNNNE